MPRLNAPLIPEGSIIRGLVWTSKDLFSKEAYEERVDREISKLIKIFRKDKTVDKDDLIKVVENFIKDVEAILEELEKLKEKAEEEEILKINGLRKLFEEESKINIRDLRSELGKFAKSIKGNTIAALKNNLRHEKRLRRGHAPMGYVLTKLKNDRYLDAEIARRAYRIGKDTAEEHSLFYQTAGLINELKQNPSKEKLDELKQLTKTLMKDYTENLQDFLNIESEADIEEARKLHRIDHYIVFLKEISSPKFLRTFEFGGGKVREVSRSPRGMRGTAQELKSTCEELIKKLDIVKKSAQNWVYQDTINAKNLERYAIKSFEYGEKLLETSKIEPGAEIPGLKIENLTVFGQVPGILITYQDPEKAPQPPPKRGLVLVHGAFGTKETMLTLGKRLAMQDFEVFIMDVAQHGDNTALFRLGVISEQIHLCVSFLRRKGMQKVGAIGHSLGAMCVLFAMTGYNSRIEYEFFKATGNLLQGIEKMGYEMREARGRTAQWQQKFVKEDMREFIEESTEYKKLKEVIFNGLEEMYGRKVGSKTYGTSSKIDAAVLLAPVASAQYHIPKQLSWVVKMAGKTKLKRQVAKQLSDLLFFKKVEQLGETFTIPEYVMDRKNDPNKVWLAGADVDDMYDVFNYVQNLDNPMDYMDTLRNICKKFPSKSRPPSKNFPKKRVVVDFIRYYVAMIKKTPKLYIYGLGDLKLLKSYIPRTISEMTGKNVGKLHIDEFETNTKKFGGEIVRIPGLNHWLTQEGASPNWDSARMPKITYKIVTFFNQNLGRGRMPPGGRLRDYQIPMPLKSGVYRKF